MKPSSVDAFNSRRCSEIVTSLDQAPERAKLYKEPALFARDRRAPDDRGHRYHDLHFILSRAQAKFEALAQTKVETTDNKSVVTVPPTILMFDASILLALKIRLEQTIAWN